MIAIGSDHGGYELKQEIIKYLSDNNYDYVDCGSYNKDSVDYPDFAKKVVKKILSKECNRGILICGTGIGISITANRFKGIRAALCPDVFTAKATREHNDANILALGGRNFGVGSAIEITKAFLETEFSNDERHKRRIEKIDS